MVSPKISLRSLLLSFIILFFSIPALSQQSVLEQKIFTSDSLNANTPREKIFIHRDKPYYNPGDTIWFKGYILTAPENISSDSSGFACIELFNAQHELIKRISTPCILGLFAGNISLPKKDFPQGEYLLRAYTRYMQNFGDTLFFESRFTIIDAGTEQWRTTIRELSVEANRLLLSASLAGEKNGVVANRTVSIRLRDKNRVLFRARALTDASGNIYIDTLLKDAGNKNLRLEIAEQENVKLQLPVKANEKKLVDLQFLPEGGTFIAGKVQRLGFKAVSFSGKGIAVKGVIKDSKGTEITAFASVHKGMGIVSFKPQAGEMYSAFLENGLKVPLPLPLATGISLRVTNKPAADSIVISIEGTPDQYGRKIYFTITSKGILAARGSATINEAGYELAISNRELRTGISQVIVYNEDFQPVNERAIFTWHNEELRLNLTQQKEEYVKKDSVSVRLKVRDSNGENIAGSFSIAVLDTSQVKVLPDAENLLSYILLSSDLKGEVEEPFYYFNQPDPDAVEALLLTEGWVSYNREAAPLVFPYEKEYNISGRVTNVFNKPVGGARLVLFGKAGRGNTFVTDTVANTNGNFVFNRFGFYETDSMSILIKAVNKNGKAFNVGVEINDPVYPELNRTARLAGAGEMLVDTVARQYAAREGMNRAAMKKNGIVLEEVILQSKKRIPGSKNLNEDGGADQVINEETLNKTPKQSLLDILQQQVPGFRLGNPPKSNALLYLVHFNIVRLVVDGVDLHYFFQPVMGLRNEYALYLDRYLNYFSAEDIKGIEVMSSAAYNTAYRHHYLDKRELISSGPTTFDFTFIEVTTKSGSGPFMKKIPGMYLLRPLYPVVAKQFYSPRYTSPAQETILPDLRQTIYWNPNVITDEKGEATVSFYTSESESRNYLIIVQGTDLKGRLGVLYQPLQIRK
jgi:hypothetical protein